MKVNFFQKHILATNKIEKKQIAMIEGKKN